MEPLLKRSLRWTLIMAILGFILGLGFLIPLPAPEIRNPASTPEEAVAFLDSNHAPAKRPLAPVTAPARNGVVRVTVTDLRPNVVFDVHTISRSVFAKDTDAYVTANFTPGRTEISDFTYCHNYDYKRQRALTTLNRYSLGDDGFGCYDLPLSELATGYVLINTPLGRLLTLKSQPGFDPRKGGTVSVLFAYHVAKIGRNDYRQLDLHVRLVDGVLRATGPKGEAFDWFNLKMTEDLFNLPNGVNSFELYLHGTKVSVYPGKDFPKVLPAKP